MALAYSVAEYCTAIWEGSHYCNLIDVELRKTMHVISGTVKSTPTQWLVEKIVCSTNLPIHEYGVEKPRLKSRHPFLERVKSINAQLHLKPFNGKKNGNAIFLLTGIQLKISIQSNQDRPFFADYGLG